MGQALVMQFSAELESLDCCVCGVTFAAPSSMIRSAREVGKFERMIYCPNGHKQGWGDSAIDKLQKELALKNAEIQREKNNSQFWQTRKEETERQLIAQKGVMTKLKKRVGHGVCPCCRRTFKQLAAHMENKHPEYAKPSDEASGVTN